MRAFWRQVLIRYSPPPSVATVEAAAASGDGLSPQGCERDGSIGPRGPMNSTLLALAVAQFQADV